METNSAVWYEHFAMDFHKKHTLIPSFKTNITFLRRLVNKQFGVVSPDYQKIQYRQSIKIIYKNYTQDINA